MPSRRELPAVAHDLLHSVLSGLHSHPEGDLFRLLRQAAHAASAPQIVLDVRQQTIEPAAARLPALVATLATAEERLEAILQARHLPSAMAAGAVLEAAFLPASLGPELHALTVRLVDDRGKGHEFQCPPAWWMPNPSERGAPPKLDMPPPKSTPVTELLQWLEGFLPRFGKSQQ